jgi:competence protein ComEA
MITIGLKRLVAVAALQFALFHSAFALQPVNINKADAKTIAESLHSIGDAKAKAIVAYRTEHGPFKTVAEFGNVKGIGDKTLEKNKQYILLK